MYFYLDVRNGVQLKTTDEIGVISQDKTIYLGRDLTDADILTTLRIGVKSLKRETQ